MSALGVFLIVGIVIYVSLSWLAGANARDGIGGARFGAVTLVVLVLLAALPWALLAWLGFAAKCEGTCTPAWRNDPDAWQYTGQLVVAVAGLAVALLATLLAVCRRYTGATILLTTTFALAVGWTVGFA